MSAGAAERLTGFVAALRSHGVRIGTGETVDGETTRFVATGRLSTSGPVHAA